MNLQPSPNNYQINCGHFKVSLKQSGLIVVACRVKPVCEQPLKMNRVKVFFQLQVPHGIGIVVVAAISYFLLLLLLLLLPMLLQLMTVLHFKTWFTTLNWVKFCILRLIQQCFKKVNFFANL